MGLLGVVFWFSLGSFVCLLKASWRSRGGGFGGRLWMSRDSLNLGGLLEVGRSFDSRYAVALAMTSHGLLERCLGNVFELRLYSDRWNFACECLPRCERERVSETKALLR